MTKQALEMFAFSRVGRINFAIRFQWAVTLG